MEKNLNTQFSWNKTIILLLLLCIVAVLSTILSSCDDSAYYKKTDKMLNQCEQYLAKGASGIIDIKENRVLTEEQVRKIIQLENQKINELAQNKTNTAYQNTTKSSKSDNQTVSQPVQEPAYNPISEWEFTDYLGKKYTLKLNNDDGTAQLNYNGITKYGSFEKSQWGYDLLAIIFDANDISVRYETPGSPFGNGGSLLYRAQLDIKNGYLYEDGNAYKAKDPTRRLKVTKR